jgi:purine-binding chemotaxis protein CheW
MSLYVLCRVNSLVCAVPAEHVSEAMRPLPTAPLAGVSPFVMGVAIFRGAPTPVIDASKLLDGDRLTKAGRFLAIRIGERAALLAVDDVLGVRDMSPESIRDLPPLLHRPDVEALDGIGTLDGDLLVVLAAARSVPDAVWASLERAKVA